MTRRVPTLPLKIIFALYALAVSSIFPAFPMLVLSAAEKENRKSHQLHYTAIFFKYFVGFFSSSILGKLSDKVGRRSVLLFSLSCTALEFVLLGAFPCYEIIYASRLFSGISDGMMSVIYASVTDAAHLNDDVVAKEFGEMSAAFIMGTLLGPVLGSTLIIQGGVSLCFLIASFIVGLAIFIVFLIMEETVPAILRYSQKFKKKDDDDLYQGEVLSVLPLHSIVSSTSNATGNNDLISTLNPLPSFVSIFSSSELRMLIYALMISQSSAGVQYVWVPYFKDRFEMSNVDVTVFFATSAVIVAFMQGCFTKCYILTMGMSEEIICLLCLLLTFVQFLSYGICTTTSSFYIVLSIFAPFYIFTPCMKALLSNATDSAKQGEIQGVIFGLRSLSTAIGSLLFLCLYPHYHVAISGATFYEQKMSISSANSAYTRNFNVWRWNETISAVEMILPFPPPSSKTVTSTTLNDFFDSSSPTIIEGRPFFVAATLYFVAFLFMLMYWRDVTFFKYFRRSSHSSRRQRGLLSQPDERKNNFDSLFYRIPT